MDQRELLLSIFQHALAAVHGRARVRSTLERLAPQGAWRVIAVGKAASSMTLGALDALGARVTQALVVTKDGHVDAELRARRDLTMLETGHPVPDARSLAAGAALLDAIAATPRTEGLLFLVSGGASSLIEAPAPGVSLEQLGEFNRWALASGRDIRVVNALRQRLSAIKGGRLAGAIGERRVLGLFISDVPGNDPGLIGSGLLGSPLRDDIPEDLPPWVRSLAQAAPARDTPDCPHIERHVIATLEDAVAAVRQSAAAQGLTVRADETRFDGDAVELANRFCHELALGPAQLCVWGGESTVHLPVAPGNGGRNQHLALAAARLLVSHEGLLLLVAGTDGTDGSTSDAGALVDSGTLERGAVGGFDADTCLARADSARFLEAAGDLLHTGPTGTNVGDLVIGLKG